MGRPVVADEFAFQVEHPAATQRRRRHRVERQHGGQPGLHALPIEVRAAIERLERPQPQPHLGHVGDGLPVFGLRGGRGGQHHLLRAGQSRFEQLHALGQVGRRGLQHHHDVLEVRRLHAVHVGLVGIQPPQQLLVGGNLGQRGGPDRQLTAFVARDAVGGGNRQAQQRIEQVRVALDQHGHAPGARGGWRGTGDGSRLVRSPSGSGLVSVAIGPSRCPHPCPSPH